MVNQYKEIIYSALLGMALGALGVFLMGHIAAVAIPNEFFSWFENTELALFIINTISQFLAFGVIAIIIGTVLGRLSKRWFLNSLVCYLAFLLYLTVGTAMVYGGEISNPFSGFTFYNLPSLLLLPVCLLASTCLSARKL
jgi:hypothetical protein